MTAPDDLTINNTVCEACGGEKDAHARMGLNANDPLCGVCRQFQQSLLMRKAMSDAESQQRKRESYFRMKGLLNG